MFKIKRAHIRNFIETYGDGDVFVDYSYLPNGTIEVGYLPNITKFASEKAINSFLPKIFNNKYKYKEYVRKIILSEKSAEIVDKTNTTCTELEKNYTKFLEDYGYIKKQENGLEL